MRASLLVPVMVLVSLAGVAGGEEQSAAESAGVSPAGQTTREFFPAGPGEVRYTDYPMRSDVLDPNGEPVDLSQMSPAEREIVVEDYYSTENAAENKRRSRLHWRRRLESREDCYFGPLEVPNEATALRLNDIFSERRGKLPGIDLWIEVVAEPFVEGVPDAPKPLLIKLYDPDGPTCDHDDLRKELGMEPGP